MFRGMNCYRCLWQLNTLTVTGLGNTDRQHRVAVINMQINERGHIHWGTLEQRPVEHFNC